MALREAFFLEKAMIFIFDIDGTLADCEHRRHHLDKQPQDWDSFFADAKDDHAIKPVVELWHALEKASHTLICCTGRSVKDELVTRTWLRFNGITPDNIHFRAENDFRPDDIIKEEMLASIIATYGEVPVMAFEDRKRCVDMWRRNGVLCAQVAEGDF